MFVIGSLIRSFVSFRLFIHSLPPIEFIRKRQKKSCNKHQGNILVNQIIIQDYLRHFFPSSFFI